MQSYISFHPICIISNKNLSIQPFPPSSRKSISCHRSTYMATQEPMLFVDLSQNQKDIAPPNSSFPKYLLTKSLNFSYRKLTFSYTPNGPILRTASITPLMFFLKCIFCHNAVTVSLDSRVFIASFTHW